MNLNNRKFKTHALVTVLFLLLAVSLEGLMYGYWTLVIQPRLYAEAESNAKILAESQARMISSALSSDQGTLIQDDFNELSDQVLIFIDPIVQQPYFLGISLELDDEVVVVDLETLNLTAGDMNCQHCFFVNTGLYSQDSYEMQGIVSFTLSDIFYEKLKKDIKEVLLIESSIALAVLFLVWVAVSFFINRLNFEIKTRKKITQQLLVAKENAEKASQTKSDFLANMSHEIRTPLNAIIGMNHIISRTELDSRQQDLLKKLGSSAKLLLNLINDLLDFSKIEAGKLDLESTTFEIEEVLNHLAELVMAKAGEKEIDILYFTNPDIPQKLIGDPLRLGQVLLNLLNNALKFTDKGEILVTVDVVEPQSTLGKNSIDLQFAIKDSGIGIEPENIEKLFHSFTQADNSTTRKFGGTGLGLSICKQLVQLMGGDISVDSTYGQGSTFMFTVQFGVETISTPVRYDLPLSFQNTHALVIDDNPLAQKIFHHMLACFGLKVSIASSAKQGIESLQLHSKRQNPIKLVLMDCKMPDMSGVEASQIIKTQLNLEIVPAIILVTAYVDKLCGNDPEDTFCDNYLVKPVSQSVLFDAIINMVTNHPLQTEQSNGTLTVEDKPLYSTKHVLLTEDNRTNQEVACALLGEFDIQVSLANNGKEAVEAVKTKAFDLIFMDLQMPEMDGFEATRLIRSGHNNQYVPIIAMTAHAMQGDREKCLNAQMNDYITKPIDVNEFFALLEKWLEKDEHGLPDKHTIKYPPKTNLKLPEFKTINIVKALQRVRGKQELLFRLLVNFKNQKADLMQQIRKAIQRNDIPQASAMVHSLKGEAGTLEANILFMASKHLEQQLKLGTNIQETHLLEVEQALAEVCKEINVLEQSVDIAKIQQDLEAVELDQAEMAAQLCELSSLLRDNNLRAKKLAKKITPLLSASQYAIDWELILKALAELDFEKAQVHLQTLMTAMKLQMYSRG